MKPVVRRNFAGYSNAELRDGYTATVQEMLTRLAGDDLEAAEYLDEMGVEIFSRLLSNIVESN